MQLINELEDTLLRLELVSHTLSAIDEALRYGGSLCSGALVLPVNNLVDTIVEAQTICDKLKKQHSGEENSGREEETPARG